MFHIRCVWFFWFSGIQLDENRMNVVNGVKNIDWLGLIDPVLRHFRGRFKEGYPCPSLISAVTGCCLYFCSNRVPLHILLIGDTIKSNIEIYYRYLEGGIWDCSGSLHACGTLLQSICFFQGSKFRCRFFLLFSNRKWPQESNLH